MTTKKIVESTKIIITLLLLTQPLKTADCTDENCKSCPTLKTNCEECKQYFFLNSTTISCDPCSSNCLKCENNKTCLNCNSGYTLTEYTGQTKKDSTIYCKINWLSLKFLSIVIGGFFGLFFIGFLFCWFMRGKKKTGEEEEGELVQSLMQDEDRPKMFLNETNDNKKINPEENLKKNFVKKNDKYRNGIEAIEEQDENYNGFDNDITLNNKNKANGENLSKSSNFQKQNSIGSKFSNGSIFKSSVKGEDFFLENDHHFQGIGVSVSQVPDYFNPEAGFQYDKQRSLREKEISESKREDKSFLRRSVMSGISKNETIYQSHTEGESQYFDLEDEDVEGRSDRGETFVTASEMDGAIWDDIDNED